MAAVAPQADQATELLQKLSLDSPAKNIEVSDATKKPSADPNNVPNGVQSERSLTPVITEFMDPALCYLPCYYSGYDGNAKDWEEYARYVNQEGVELSPSVYGDNGSIMYHGYGYAPYGPYSPAATPVPSVGHDGQMYSAQHYQYPYFQSMTPTSGQFPTPSAATKGEVATAGSDLTASNGLGNGGGAKGNNGTSPAKATYQNSSYNMNGSYGRGVLPGGVPASGYQDPRYAYDGLHSPIPWLENPYFLDGQPRPVTSSSMAISSGNGVHSSRNQNYRPHMMNLHYPRPMSGVNTTNGYINRMYPNKLYNQYGSAYRSGHGYGANSYDTQSNGRGWLAVDNKYKARVRGNGFYNYGNESVDGLNELNRGPRAKNIKNVKSFTQVLAVKGQSLPLIGTTDNEEKLSSGISDREQYNRPDFPETYADAKFFIIKSYSEDDVHKSVKYNVWASTPNGNKKLDAAYKEAQQRPGGCPVFLFFSVNTSGQFVGVAEMTGPVDFNKNVEYWQQDKWIGCFPVKWHIVKDVPNTLLKHIILENNENKSVTNSRDTQEVMLDQGIQLIKIFKEHVSKQCILDDFNFYEDRQRRIQEKKAKFQHFQKVWEGKPAEEKTIENAKGDVRPQKLGELANDLHKDAVSVDGNAVLNSGETVKSLGTAAADSEKNLDDVANSY